MKLKVGILAVLLCVLLTVFFVHAAEPKFGGTLKVGVTQSLGKLDSYLTTALADRVRLLHVMDQLVCLGEDLSIVGNLADSWDISEDCTVYTFYLRKGVLFHDGTEMTAEDVAYSIKRFCTNSARSKDFEIVKEVNIKDTYTVELVLKEKSVVFLSTLANPICPLVIYPENIYENQGGKITHPIGTGPFEFVEWVPDVYLKLKRFEDYVADKDPATGFAGKRVAYVDYVIFQPIPEFSVKAMALETGEVDIIGQLEIPDAKRLDLLPEVETNIYSIYTYYDIRIGHKKDSIMSDLNMRKALVHAINKEQIATAVCPENPVVATSALLSGTFWYTDAHKEYPEYNLELAREYLKKAGYNGEPIVLVLSVSSQFMIRIGIVLEANLREAGINVKIRELESGAYVDCWLSGDFDLFVSGNSIRPDPDIYYGQFWHSKTTPTGYNNPEWDRLVDEGRKVADPEARREIYEKLHKEMNKDIPWIALAFRSTAMGKRADVKGFNMDWGANYYRVWNVWLDR